MKSLFLTICAFFSFVSSYGQIDGLYGHDIRLFEGEQWKLAQAVKRQDTKKIKQIVSSGRVNVNYQEPRFGKTLLIWAVMMNRIKSAEALLESGAEPDIKSTYNGTSALMEAADKGETSKYVKLLLQHGANPNIDADNKEPNRIATPLIAAAKKRHESVKLLVEAGAEIDYVTSHGGSALDAALRASQVETSQYLIMEKNADYKRAFGVRTDGSEIGIADLLRHWVFPLDSEEYKKKMQIVAYLKEQGIDYRSAKVPNYYFSNYTKEFLDKYRKILLANNT